MDPVGTARCRRALICFFLLSSLLLAETPSQHSTEQARQLFEQQRWQEIVQLAETTPAHSPDFNYYYGSALARLQRWEQAREVFAAGQKAAPQDKRFPQELAGVAFKQKQYSRAVKELKRARRLAPDDPYTNDFLGTIFYLRHNYEAAVKYWNPAGKPQIAEIRSEPATHLDPVVLDRAFAFAPASVLRMNELLATADRLDALEIYPSWQIDLAAREDGRFDAVFRNYEKNGLGKNKWMAVARMFRGLPSQTIDPEYFNIGRKGINFTSKYRFDAQKRRILAGISLPLFGSARQRVQFGMDLRDENWALRASSKGVAPLLGATKLKRQAFSATYTNIPSGWWNWSAGVEFSHRDFRDVELGSALDPVLLLTGNQLKQTARLGADLLRLPEKRLFLRGELTSQAGRIWSSPSHGFEKLQASAALNWYPQAEGDDYHVQEQVWYGRGWGTLPFDELTFLGIGGDNQLWLRGHIATRDGKKGTGPLGRNYFLSNWEMDKNIYHWKMVTVKAGPFLDTGKITDPLPGLGSQKWLVDMGPQVKVKYMNFGVNISYGRDLRNGHGGIYFAVTR